MEIYEDWVDPMYNLASIYLLSNNKEKAAVYVDKLKRLNVDPLALELLMDLD